MPTPSTSRYGRNVQARGTGNGVANASRPPVEPITETLVHRSGCDHVGTEPPILM